MPAAFVTFNDRYTQSLASTGMHSHDELAWRVQARTRARAPRAACAQAPHPAAPHTCAPQPPASVPAHTPTPSNPPQAAPGPDEIVWPNLRMRHWQRVLRTLAVWALFVAILVLHLPLIAAIQAVVNLENGAPRVASAAAPVVAGAQRAPAASSGSRAAAFPHSHAPPCAQCAPSRGWARSRTSPS